MKNKYKDKKKKDPITRVRLILYLKTTGENLELCPLYWLKLNALVFKWRKWGGICCLKPLSTVFQLYRNGQSKKSKALYRKS
jgi:hypothetical protein